MLKDARVEITTGGACNALHVNNNYNYIKYDKS